MVQKRNAASYRVGSIFLFKRVDTCTPSTHHVKV